MAGQCYRDSLSVLSRVAATSVPVMPRVPGHVSADTLLRYRRCVQELQVPLKLISGVYVQQYFLLSSSSLEIVSSRPPDCKSFIHLDWALQLGGAGRPSFIRGAASLISPAL